MDNEEKDLIEELDELNKKYENMNKIQKTLYNIKNEIYMLYLKFKYRDL